MKTPPRIFVAATRQDDGKTTTAVGLLMQLMAQQPRVGFIKPVGQRYVELDDGTKVDKDVWLIRRVLGLSDAAQYMSPVTVPSGFTREYIRQREPERLAAQVKEAFAVIADGKTFVLIEGTGHAGVGAVFDLSNARVAELLGSPVVLVSGGGIGRPVDEILLNAALFRQHGVRIAGVILNKVAKERCEEVREYTSRALAWHGIKVVGVVPYVPLLSQPTLREVCRAIAGTFISCVERDATLYAHVTLLSHFSLESVRTLLPSTLVVATGDQSEFLVACAGEEPAMWALRANVCGIVLTDGIAPKPHIVKMLQHARVPVILSDMPAYEATSHLSRMVAKLQPDNPEKMEAISQLFSEYVDFSTLLEAVRE
ncbi:MAG: AAA family ATPase [bacterium]|nr:AAA family ATPase [bacterium]